MILAVPWKTFVRLQRAFFILTGTTRTSIFSTPSWIVLIITVPNCCQLISMPSLDLMQREMITRLPLRRKKQAWWYGGGNGGIKNNRMDVCHLSIYLDIYLSRYLFKFPLPFRGAQSIESFGQVWLCRTCLPLCPFWLCYMLLGCIFCFSAPQDISHTEQWMTEKGSSWLQWRVLWVTEGKKERFARFSFLQVTVGLAGAMGRLISPVLVADRAHSEAG